MSAAARRLTPALPEELETVVLKAPAKGPEERYATAKELAEDVGRYLRDEPIRARRPTLGQRAKRWARRNRPVAITAAVSAALLLVLAVVALAISNVLISGEKNQKAQALQEKETALVTARINEGLAEEQRRLAVEQEEVAQG